VGRRVVENVMVVDACRFENAKGITFSGIVKSGVVGNNAVDKNAGNDCLGGYDHKRKGRFSD
jgi:hypothetical protein